MNNIASKNRIEEIPSRTKTKIIYDRLRPQYEMAQAKVSRTIRKLLIEQDINASVRIRIKTFDSYFNKVLRYYNEGRKEKLIISDLIGIRIICSFLGDLLQVKKILLQNFKVIEVEEKSSQFSFKEFGYDSIHLQIGLPKDLISTIIPYSDLACEVQLRTKLQDAWAEVEHEIIYKSEHSPLNAQLRRKLASLNASLTLSDIIFQEIREQQRDRMQRDKKRRESIRDKIDSIEGIQYIQELPDFVKEETDAFPKADIDNGTLDQLLGKALDAHSRQDYDEALILYNKILEANHDDKINSVISNHRGMVYFVLSNYEKAITDFTRAVQTNPNNFRAYNNRGLAYRMLKIYDRAIEDFERSIEVHPMQTDAYYGRAQVYFELENYPNALQDCNNALNIEPEFKPALRFKQLIRARLF